MTYPNALAAVLIFFTGFCLGVWVLSRLIKIIIRMGPARYVMEIFESLRKMRPVEYLAVSNSLTDDELQEIMSEK